MRDNKIIKNKTIFWDYDLKKSDFNNPNFKIWLLSRKINFGDLEGIRKKDLKKFLKRLNINNSLKELLSNFLKQNA